MNASLDSIKNHVNVNCIEISYVFKHFVLPKSVTTYCAVSVSVSNIVCTQGEWLFIKG